MSQCSRIANPAPRPFYQAHYVACAPLRCYSTDALIDAALADLGVTYVLDVFVNRLLSQGKLVELFPGWQTYDRTFFTVTPKSRFIEFLLASLDAQR